MRDDQADDPGSPGWKALAVALGAYAVVVAVATYPMVASIRSALPSNVDPVQHLTVMRWYKACLLEGRSPFLLREIQHPLGATLGSFSPMLLQTSAYLVLSSLTSNDVLCYNLLWFSGFLLTGVGTFALAWRVVEDRACAWFAGLAAMLGGPMMLHAHGHLELIYVGWFSLFLAAWMRMVDRPGWRSTAVAAASYGVMTLSTGYFAVLAVVPAAWYATYRAIGALRRGDRAWFRPRFFGLAGFAGLVGPFAILAFAGQLWNVAHGVSMARSLAEFEQYGVPWYGYAMPSVLHPLARLFGFDAFDPLGHPAVECGSYLGVATLGLILYAAIRRVGPRRAGFWWSVTAILVVLSFGAYAQFGPYRLGLPGAWLYQHVFAFRMLRAPGRFNLFASVGAAILAAAGLKHLIARCSIRQRWAACAAISAVAMADLSMVPFTAEPLTPMPASYARLVEADPKATFLDAPLHHSGFAHPLTAASGYWQTIHHGRTSGGYSGHANIPFDNRLVHNTPFSADAMASPGYLDDPESATFGIVSNVRFLDYAWLYLTANDLRYVVLHRSPTMAAEPIDSRSHLESLLGVALVSADDDVAVFDRDKLPPPARPVLTCSSGWRGGWQGRPILIASKVAEVAAYNPDASRELTFTLKAQAFRQPRTVRLLSNGVELAHWDVRPDQPRIFLSPPFRLPAGLQTLAIASDAEERPTRRHEAAIAGDDRPYSLSVAEVSLRAIDATRDLAGAEPKGNRAVPVRR